MTTEKILFFFAFVAATPLAHSTSLWGNRVFPDDYQWLQRHKIKGFDDSDNEMDAKHEKVCQTEECLKVASSFLDSMNKSVDPCENFYEFTCGRWGESNPILPSAVSSNSFEINQNLIYQRISEILETEPDDSDILPVKQAKKYYRSCMDTEKLEQRSIEPIETFVTEAGGWPIAMKNTDWDYKDNSWQEIDRHYARLTGHKAFYDVKANSAYGIFSDGSEFGELVIMTPELLDARSEVMSSGLYHTFLTTVIKLFVERSGGSVSSETYAKEASDLVEFELKLHKLITANKSPSPLASWLNSMPLHEFIDSYGSNASETPAARIDWQSGIQDLFDPLNIKVDPSTTTYMENNGYINGLGPLLKKTPLRTIVNYVHWNFIVGALTYTTESMRDEIFKITGKHRLFGVKERPPRWMECVKRMKMTLAASYIFSKKYFPKSARSAAREMMKNIQNGLEANIDESNWLDKTSKSVAKEKIRAMKIFLGAPEWYTNGTAVTEYYKGLTISNQYLDNALSYMRFERKQKLMPYTMSEEVEDIPSMTPITVNAEYNEIENVLNIPPAVFNSPLLTPGLPDNVNYGQVGFLIGHEMGHGFDDTGIFTGNDGDDTPLSINVLKNYYQRAHCFVDQFDKYFGVTAEPEEEGVTLEFDDLGDTRGSNTKSENIADSTGLQAVFQAYKNLNEKKGFHEPKLPGLEKFTDDQLFFIAFGNYWCGSETPEYEMMTANDPHSPGNLRVNGGVSNTNDFAKVFNCPAGSAMNPSDKCNIWENPGSTRKVKPMKRIKSKRHHWLGRWKN